MKILVHLFILHLSQALEAEEKRKVQPVTDCLRQKPCTQVVIAVAEHEFNPVQIYLIYNLFGKDFEGRPHVVRDRCPLLGRNPSKIENIISFSTPNETKKPFFFEYLTVC